MWPTSMASNPRPPKHSRLKRAALSCCSSSSSTPSSPIWCCRRSGPITSTRRASPTADGDADRAGHSRRSDQCRAGRRQQGRALRHARRRLVSRRSGHAEILHRNRRQRAARPPLSRRAGEPSLLSRPARGSRVRKADGTSADHRHHVRFWKVLDQGEEKRPVWLGDATFDRSVGVSHYTGAITHHIDADIDAERSCSPRPGSRRHGGGEISGHRRRADDGGTQRRRRSLLHRRRGVDSAAGRGLPQADRPAVTIPSPAATEIKDQIWQAIADAMGK